MQKNLSNPTDMLCCFYLILSYIQETRAVETNFDLIMANVFGNRSFVILIMIVEITVMNQSQMALYAVC